MEPESEPTKDPSKRMGDFDCSRWGSVGAEFDDEDPNLANMTLEEKVAMDAKMENMKGVRVSPRAILQLRARQGSICFEGLLVAVAQGSTATIAADQVARAAQQLRGDATIAAALKAVKVGTDAAEQVLAAPRFPYSARPAAAGRRPQGS